MTVKYDIDFDIITVNLSEIPMASKCKNLLMTYKFIFS